MTKNSKLQEVPTSDGSITFYNEQYDDIYHSKSGAVEESFEKFAKPGLLDLLKTKPEVIHILDICFGMGYNTAAAIDFIKEQSPETRIKVIALENDIEIIKKIRLVSPDFKNFSILKNMNLESSDSLETEEENVSIKILLGDARVEILNVKDNFADAVFHDAFAPSKHKEMWAADFFNDISKKVKQGGRLLTYSCARWVRNNLEDAGFEIRDGPKVGRRAPSTIAIKK